jgi:hypothetical protein
VAGVSSVPTQSCDRGKYRGMETESWKQTSPSSSKELEVFKINMSFSFVNLLALLRLYSKACSHSPPTNPNPPATSVQLCSGEPLFCYSGHSQGLSIGSLQNWAPYLGKLISLRLEKAHFQSMNLWFNELYCHIKGSEKPSSTSGCLTQCIPDVIDHSRMYCYLTI